MAAVSRFVPTAVVFDLSKINIKCFPSRSTIRQLFPSIFELYSNCRLNAMLKMRTIIHFNIQSTSVCQSPRLERKKSAMCFERNEKLHNYRLMHFCIWIDPKCVFGRRERFRKANKLECTHAWWFRTLGLLHPTELWLPTTMMVLVIQASRCTFTVAAAPRCIDWNARQ